MIDYLRPVPTSAPPYEVHFECGSDGKHKLTYRNGGVEPYYVFFRPADRINGNPLLSALEVVLGGLPEDVTQVNVLAKSENCKKALMEACGNTKQVTIARKRVTFHF
ncbi:MAG: hypothetical protein QXT19_02295 [Candidatus Woesearchaeota archaeon]